MSTGILPQEYATTFYVVKGVLGLVGTLLVVYHTNQAWTYVVKHGTYGQRWRYFSLMLFMGVATESSVQQIQQKAPVQAFNIATAVVILFTIVAMVISIRESRGRKA